MNRRGFLRGLGALLATSAIVKPVVGAFALPPSVPPMPDGYYVCICSPWQLNLYEEIMAFEAPSDDWVPAYSGRLGIYVGMTIAEDG